MFKNLLKSEFSRNVMTLLTGSAIAQFIPLLLTPILSRLFSPEEFGLFAFIISIISLFSAIATGRYELAILLPKEDKKAINVFALCFIILISICLILFGLVFFFEDGIINFIQKPSLKGWLYFIPLTLFFTSSYVIFTYWSNRKARFIDTSIGTVIMSSTKTGVNLYAGLSKVNFFESKASFLEFFKALFKKSYVIPSGISTIGIGGLILGSFVGYSSAVFFFSIKFFKNDRGLLSSINKETIKEMAKKHDKFPKINSVHALTDQFKNSGVIYVISYIFGDLVLGFYSMTLRILTTPLAIIGNSFGQVFLQKTASIHADNGDFIPLIKKTISKLSLIATPIFILILLFGPQLFSFVLGEKWVVAGEYARYLTPWLFLHFVFSPVFQVAVIIEKQEQLFYVSLVHNVIVLGSILIGGFVFNEIKLGFLILSILQIGFYFFAYRWVLKISHNSVNR
jgi:O-antigen/teichoic acid export membrane protein